MQPTSRYPTLVGSYLIKPPLAACHIPPIILLILKFGGWQHPDQSAPKHPYLGPRAEGYQARS